MTNNQLTGTASVVVQAHSIAGGVHLTLQRPVLRPAALPAAPRVWVDRGPAWDRVTDWCDPQASSPGVAAAVQITGPAGIGKQALAVRWLHHHRARYPDGQLVVRLGTGRGDSALTVPQALRHIITALGVPAEDVPSDLTALSALYRTVTADAAVAILAIDAPLGSDAGRLLPTSPAAVLLVTARSPVTSLIGLHVPEVRLDPLLDQFAEQLLGELAARPVPGTIITQLARRSGGRPDTLSMLGAWLRHSPDLADAPHDASAVHAFLFHLNIISPQGMATMDSVDAWIDRVLHPAEHATGQQSTTVGAARRLHILLGLYPDRTIDTALARALLSDDIPGHRHALDLLIQGGLALDHADGRVTIPDAVGQHARALLRRTDHTSEVGFDDRRAAVRTMCDYFLVRARPVDHLVTGYRTPPPYLNRQPAPAPLFADSTAALEWLNERRYLLLDLAQLARSYALPETAWHLADALWALLLHYKHPDVRLRADGIGTRAALQWLQQAQTADADPEIITTATRALAEMTKRLGRGLIRRDRHPAATTWLNASLALYQSINDRAGVTAVREALAQQHLYRGQTYLEQAETAAEASIGYAEQARSSLDKARHGFRDVLLAFRELQAHRNAALTLLNLGDTCAALARTQGLLQHRAVDLDRLEVALGYLRDASSAFDTLPKPDRYNAARVLQSLGHAELLHGELETATDHLERAVVVFAGFNNRTETRRTVLLLADVAHAAGRRQEEIRLLGAAQELHVLDGADPDLVIEQRLAALKGGR